ncbi:Uu.00g010170.m01.CDS01 [Anthostomella pinea]|uniref:Uu.00g010170.m01.CDS01 n=1 Tax=Anthostomella pinea TaxID=933095 RepID=A0AAI8VYR8_9PEZI|nr:Uu.00g010170.m01.CDS01 [Anthostomella pinea]
MTERLTDEQVAGLLALLKKDAPIDAKVQQVTAIKSGIKQHNVPDSCVAPLFEGLRLASSSQHSALVNAGFTALNHLLTRLSRQEPKYLSREAKQTLPLIVDKMGDQKDKFRTLAIQAMATMYTQVPMDAERFVRNTAMVGKNPRAKEASMQWLLQMHNENGLQFRAYVPTLMELLEDADGMVRDTAKTTVIELFRDAPNAAKSDLKRQLKNFKVRPAIESAIVKELAPTSAKTDSPSRPVSVMQTRPNLAASVSSLASERPTTPAPEAKTESVEPTYVNTQRELDDIFKGMHMWFEGKETEQNWLKREESVTKLRRLIAGNAASDFPDAFVAGCRALLDGIIKAVTSLRTSLSKEGCALVQDLANTFGPGIDPMVELLMQTFIKLCAATKKIASQQANTTVDTIIGRTTYNARIMQHIWGACQDKNVQPRTYATGWLTTLLKKEMHHKSHLEHGGGLETTEKCIKKGLNDPNPGVREGMRATYWIFAPVWPARAEALMDALDATAQKLLQKDPNNPNATKKVDPAPRPEKGFGFEEFTPETRLCHGKYITCPNSFGFIKLFLRGVDIYIGVNPNSYRGCSQIPRWTHDGPSTERASPSESVRSKTFTPKTISGSPRRTAPKTRPGHVATASESNVPTPSKVAASKAAASPRVSPAKAKPTVNGFNSSSPSKANEELTLLVPNVSDLKESLQPSSSPKASPQAVSPRADSPMAPASKASSLQESSSQASSPRASSPQAPSQQPASPQPPVEEEEDEDHTIMPASATTTPSKALKVYEDPFTEDQTTPRPTSNGATGRPVLEDKPVNEDAANITLVPTETNDAPMSPIFSPGKSRQNSRLLDSGIARVKAQTLDVHGFRKLQSLIRDKKLLFGDAKYDALLVGLFEYLESPLDNLSTEKVQDVKAQILATIKLLLKKDRDSFQPHVSRGLEALLAARTFYDARTHIVSGLELLADELVSIGDADEITVTMTRNLTQMDLDTKGYRSLSMGLHVLKELIDSRTSFVPNDSEIGGLTSLASRCLESKESGVRMDAVQLCVALHARLGETKFWGSLTGIKDDPKNLITYYVVKRQRETGTGPA